MGPRTIGLAAALALVFPAWPCRGADLTASQSLNGGAALSLDGASPPGDQSVTRNASGVWAFNDKDGNGSTGDAVIPPGMSMGGKTLSTTDGATDIRLDLNGGDLTGNAGSTTFQSRGVGGNNQVARSVSVTNLGTVSIGSVDLRAIDGWGVTSGSFALGTAGDPATSVTTSNLITNCAGHSGDGGSVTIYTDGDVQAARIDTYGEGANPGNVRIGSAAVRAGEICTGRINTRSGTAGSVEIYGRGDVTTRDILAGASYRPGRSGIVTVDHDGALTAGTISTRQDDYTGFDHGLQGAGDVTLNGDAGAEPRGSLTLAQIDTSIIHYSGTGDKECGHVNISGYATVEISGAGGIALDAHNIHGGEDDYAGNVIIDDITDDITIGGSIDLNGPGTNPDGDLTLRCGNAITLASLDLDRVRTARLDAGRNTLVLGAITNFSAGNNDLRCPPGQRVYYFCETQTDPALQAGNEYDLKDWDGTSPGGRLMPKPVPGTIVIVQ
jgi:hypothetical protein